jgi:hypothetical protein
LRAALRPEADAQAPSIDATDAWTAVADGPAGLGDVISAAVDQGAARVLVVPMAALSDAAMARSDADAVGRAIDDAKRSHPGLEIRSIGGREADPAAAGRVANLLRMDQPVDDSVAAAALARAFGDRADRLGEFLAALRRGLPDDTAILLRGSAVNGASYESGRPFDAKGPGTSDLDVVVIGETVGDLWVEEARLLGGVNSLPLCDGEEWVAPTLDPARREAQAIVGRPVSIQSMAQWFLDLRAAVQDQAYMSLDMPDA